MRTNLIDNRQIRVFISSTFRDMQDERDYLMKRTFPKLRKLAAERDVTLTELDLRWGITEEEAKTGKVVEICLREIENSIPFFIGIIGNRYGWVPEEKDLSKNVTERFTDVNIYLERHLSVTEMEMQFGVLQRKEDMHAYFYIKEGEESSKADNPEMLERLKEEVQASRYSSTTYASPEDLGIQVQQAFTDLLNQLFPEGHLSELEKERIGQRSFMNQLCQNYIRDDKNFQILDEWMQEWERHQMVVSGVSGLGKSALIANWVKEKLSDEQRDYNIIYHFTGNGGSESHHEHIMKVLIDEINDVYGWEEEENTNKSQEDKLNDLFLKVASEGKKSLLIVFDAVNQIIDTDNAKLLNWLPIPPRNIKILFSTLEDDRTMEVFRNRHYPEFVLQPLDVERRRLLVTEYLWLYRKKLTDAQIERIVTDKQSENTLVLKTLLDELINYGVFEKLDERIDYYLLPDTIEDFYQALLQSYEDDFGKDFVKQILSLIAVSRSGLSEDEILAITRYKQLYWSQFYCAFISHFNTKNGLIYFSHQYVQHAVWTRYRLENTDSAKPYRESIISYFNSNDITDHNRQISELAFQYFHTDDCRNLYKMILNIDSFSMFYATDDGRALLASYWRKLLKSDSNYYRLNKYIDLTTDYTKLNNIGTFASEYMGDYRTSLKCKQTCLQKVKKIKEINNSDIAIAYHNIGRSFDELGDYHKALKYYSRALNILEKAHDIENTSNAFNSIGNVYDSIGDYNNALDFYFKALNIREKVLGQMHPYIAILYNNIGVTYDSLGDYDKALEYGYKALNIRENILGLEHPDTADSYNNIGGIYDILGDYDKALDCYYKALTIQENILGQEHPVTAISYNNIGIAYSHLGNYDKALEYYKLALEIREKVLGKEHPDMAYSYDSIGIAYSNLGNYDKAQEYCKQALEIQEKVLGKEHPNTAHIYNSISGIYYNLEDYDKALEYGKQALGIQEKVLGKEHPDTAMSYNSIGLIYYNLEDYDKALEYYKQALGIQEEVLGKDHPDTVRSYIRIGFVYCCLDNYGKALEYYKQALEIQEKVLGKEHLDTAKSYDDIGAVYYSLGDNAKALEYYFKSLIILEKILGVEHPDTATRYDNIGVVYENLGDYNKALEYFSKALDIYEIIFGPEHPNIATSYTKIGRVYYSLGLYDKTLEYYSKELTINEKSYGVENTSTSTSYTNIGNVYYNIGDFDNALEYYSKALAIFEKILGLEHPNTATTYYNIGCVYYSLGDYNHAIEYYSKVYDIREKILGLEHPDTKSTLEIIAELKELVKNGGVSEQ